jgi:hypothetical protein
MLVMNLPVSWQFGGDDANGNFVMSQPIRDNRPVRKPIP